MRSVSLGLVCLLVSSSCCSVSGRPDHALVGELVRLGKNCAYCRQSLEHVPEAQTHASCQCQHTFHPNCYQKAWEKCWGCMTILERMRAVQQRAVVQIFDPKKEE